jgi:gas vesicle protein
MKDEGLGSGSVLLAFLLGGVVGAGLAFLVAPQSGEETRRKIKELADDIKDKTNEYINEARDKASAAADEGKGYYDEKKSLIKAAIDAGKDAYEKEKEKFAKG